eukprot:TRINITY_DN14934_c0_g1_i1.p1 TRINITY_DN14934_c0_g1~~TRINITY_DN14934_c0_g1_i1.p1  ORF type:complete len:637 (-),score=95.30 TRINITY_DN14934_c0_g1_i1:69-1979(-)
MPFSSGEELEYWSRTMGRWWTTRVICVRDFDGAVQVEVKPGEWILVNDQKARLRRKIPLIGYTTGQEVAYWSVSMRRWIQAHITEMRSDGAVQVDIKPGFWMSVSDQAEKLKPACELGSTHTHATGDEVEHWSATQGKWMQTSVVEVRPADGAVRVSIKPEAWITCAEQDAKLQPKASSCAESIVEESDGPVYEFVEKAGFFIVGDADDPVLTEAEARKRALADHHTYLGYTKQKAGNDEVFLRKRGNNLIKIDYYNSYLLSCKAIQYSGPLFEDAFCEDKQRFSGGFENGNGGEPWAVWKRPGRGQGMCDRDDIKLFGSIHPNDLRQGGVGDCSLIASISALAEFPGAVMRLFKGRRVLSNSGRYDVELWDWGSKSWRVMTLDDRFAAADENAIQPKFAGISGTGEIYPMLIEKAVAVMVGGYGFLNGVMPTWALGVLTGCPSVFEFNRDDQGLWSGYQPEYGPESATVPERTLREDVWGLGQGSSPRADADMWRTLDEWDREQYIMCCGIAADGKSDQNSIDGLLYMHAYSLIQVKSNIAGSPISLVQLRNPHGRGESTLAWHDTDARWSQNPAIAEACEMNEKDARCNDGLFWISFEDFFGHFNTVYIVKCSMEKAPPPLTSLNRCRSAAAEQ